MRKRDNKNYRRGEKSQISLPLTTLLITRLMAQKEFVHGKLSSPQRLERISFHKIVFWLATGTDLHLMKNRSKYRPNFVSLKKI